jgi:hypothetical protein
MVAPLSDALAAIADDWLAAVESSAAAMSTEADRRMMNTYKT